MRAKPADSRAARRVANYLRALGLGDKSRVRELSQLIVAEVTGPTAEEHAMRAVARAQARFEAWRSALYSALPEGVDPLWLRAFIRARPELFLGDVEPAQRAALVFGEPLAGKEPKRARFRPQTFERARVPGWLLGLAAPITMAWAATHALWRAVAADGWSSLDLGWVSLFAFLFFLASVGLCTAVTGYVTRPRTGAAPLAPLTSAEGSSTAEQTSRELPHELPRTALVMPIYHESAEDVFAALAGMRESLAALPGGGGFEIFVLSDSRDPEVCADEERAFRRVAAASESIPIYYHRRAQNEHQKAGNLAEFFETWGPRYEYAVTLDADSVMSGAALVWLVRQMEAQPQLALLQAPITLHRAETLFARALQFSSSVCGPMFTRGLAQWSGAHANYYGHNAVIRVSAFLDCCALPKLEGEPPFGGQVLSHDFVEAALLCRAGWEVRIAHDLPGGSYEELPPTLPEYVARDHRWCQGNFQHLQISLMHGLQPMSRIHMLLGAFAYLAAPTWLLFMLLGVLEWRQTGAAFEDVAALVSLGTIAILVGPWLLGVLASAGDPARRRAHGGGLRLAVSTLVGLLLGAVLAPLLMLHHTRIVLSILMGQVVGWGAQQRRAAGDFVRTLQAELPATLLGVAVALGSWLEAPQLFWWLAPLWVPWSLAIPINLAVSSAIVGRLARRVGLFLVPSERQPQALLSRIDELRVLTRSDTSARFRDLVLDPVLVAAHVARLEGKRSTESPGRLSDLRRRALGEGPASLSAAEWRVLTEDADSMQLLHREAWRRWPVESWDIARRSPQVPLENRPEAAVEDPPEMLLPSVPASRPASRHGR